MSQSQSAYDPDANRVAIRIWLGIVSLAIFALVIVGGATRLTDSGLSITEWKPIHGVIPPLSEAQWEAELELYRQIPEYQQINKGMSLAEFKYIYWWEWAHRLLARGVGVLFAVPLLVFWFSGRIERRLRWPLVVILALGGLQGFIGWWMVTSGLVDRVDVSQYRLATHLTLACVIFAAIVWVSRGLAVYSDDPPPSSGSANAAAIITIMVLVQIYLGGLVAGLDAGLAYNSWPLMDGALVPSNLFTMHPVLVNFFENAKTVQFTHRVFGYLLWLAVLAHMIASLARAPGTTHARRTVVLFVLVTLQAAIGISTLLLQVPVSWALAHQGMALVVLAFAVAHWRAFRGSYSLPETVLRPAV
ncbi:COX15/CtaA family protein [Hoeflea sp.]|uniref:COX15/CtaA family protein n=1 Tax=Hoeflea sp. TaxID=1940281 RepID=UPI003B017141